MQRSNTSALLVILVALAALLVGAYLIFSPFAAPLVLALVVAITAHPLHQLILRKVGEARRGLAAGLTCGVLVLAVFLPLVWTGWAVVKELPSKGDVVKRVQGFSTQFKEKALYKNNPWVQEVWKKLLSWSAAIAPVEGETQTPTGADPAKADPASSKPDAESRKSVAIAPPDGETRTPTGADPAKADPASSKADADSRKDAPWAHVGDAFAWLRASLFPIVSGTAQVFLKFCLMLFVLFFFLRDGAPLLASLKRQIPLDPAQLDRVARKFAQVSRSIIRGTIGTALAQGVCATIAYAVVGIPAILWGFVTTICALIPPLGTTLVTVPMIAYLILNEHYWQSIVLGVVSIGIGLLDNILKPLLMREGLQVHSLWLFLAILGGLNAFGPMGIIYGPMVLVFLGTFVALFVREESKQAAQPPAPPQQSGTG